MIYEEPLAPEVKPNRFRLRYMKRKEAQAAVSQLLAAAADLHAYDTRRSFIKGSFFGGSAVIVGVSIAELAMKLWGSR